MIVLSAAGMLNGGRILHHLKARLPDARNTVLFAGYQAEGSKGRFLQDGVANVNAPLTSLRIHHQEVPIEAEIVTMASLSAHGDYQDVLEWIGRIKHPPRRILLNHGTPAAMLHLQAKIQERFQIEVKAVTEPQTVDLW
jgi:metallo-beta-lactamase family protein